MTVASVRIIVKDAFPQVPEGEGPGALSRDHARY